MIFPALFIGGTAGVFVHQLIPGVPLGFAFTCVFAAVPGALVSAPFSVVLLAAFVSQVGGFQTAPVLIAVVTAYLTMEGVKYAAASRKAARAPKGGADAPAGDDQSGSDRAGPGTGAQEAQPCGCRLFIHAWSGSMSVLVESAAESVSSADIEVRDPLRIGDRFA